MKNLHQYIEELLYHHQCVIIPELGAFITNRVSAVINENRTISPPRKLISFNSRLTSNDGLLINHISKKEAISYEEAQEFVTKSIEECKCKLKSGNKVEFQNVGILREIGSNRIDFTPSQHNFLTDSFGMTTIIAQEANVNQKESQIIMPTDTSSNLGNKSSAPTYKKDNTLEYLKYAAIIVLGITALSYGFFISMANYPNNENSMLVDLQSIQKEVESHISEATFLSAAPLELPSLKLNVVKIPDERKVEIKKPTIATNKTKAKVTNNNISEFKYHVIAGAFSKEENAKTKVDQLRKMGFKSTIIGRSRSGLYQVCYQSFKVESEAEEFNKTIKNDKKLDSWILKTN